MTLTELNEIKNNYKVLEIAVDFINPSYNISRAKHLDNARYIVCTLTENGIPRTVKENEVARIRLQKPDKTYVYNDCDILEDGRVFITLTEQILAVAGNAACDIQLADEETEIIYSTKNFIINIDKTAVNNSVMESSNEFNALNNLISTNKKLNDELNENEEIRKANETERIENENIRLSNENVRVTAENERINSENTRNTNETKRINAENIRIENENTRQSQETDRKTNTATAVANAEAATQRANNAADDLQEKLDNHHFVLTEDKDVAGGVPSLNGNGQISKNEVPIVSDLTATSDELNIMDGVTATTEEINVLDGITATTTELNYVDGVTDNIQTQLNNKAPLTSPALSGTPTAPTAAAGTNTTQIATTAFVQAAVSNGIAASDAMIIKGTIGTSGTVTALPTTYKTGWTYRVVTAGTYAGQVCEIGDLIVALTDRSGTNNANSDWCVAQTNINGAITGIKSGDAYISVSQSGSTVTIAHKDVARADNASAVSPSFAETFTSVKSITSDSKGHITAVDTETVKIPNTIASSNTNGLMSSSDKTKLDYTNIAYGTCSTAAATAEKEIIISGNENWSLQTGSIIIVKFTVSNTASSVTLNVNGTGAKSIWYNNAVYTSTSNGVCGYANRYTTYMYDGTYWVWISNGIDNNTTYSNATLGQGYGTCSTAEATVDKDVTLSGYVLSVGGIVAVKFTYAVPANATMNINGKGAKPIYYRGAAVTDDIIAAGDIGVFIYNGSQYHLLTIDRMEASVTNLSNYLPLSGGTMNGDIGIPIEVSSIDGSVPYCGSEAVQDSVTAFSNYKTYLGTYHQSDGTWYNIISVRHRNGWNDGSYYGMYLKSLLTKSGDLSWGKQCNKNLWQDERIILDSDNYSKYSLPLSGGTVTGCTYFNQGNIVCDLANGSGTSGYMYACQIKVNSSYQNQPIYFRISQRNRFGEIKIQFANASSSDTTTISSFTKTGNISAYIVKSATSTYDLYIQKSESYDSISVLEMQKGGYMKDTIITMKNQTVATLPEGCIAAALETYTLNISGNASTASIATSATRLSTARTITIGNQSNSFDGTSNISFNASSMGLATASHTHSYLPLSGGTITGNLKIGSASYAPTFNNNIMTITNGQFYVCTNSGYGIRIGGDGTYSNWSLGFYSDYEAGSTSTKPSIQFRNSAGYLNSSTYLCASYLASSSYIYIYLPSSGGTLAVASSDIRLKENIKDTQITNALSVVNSIKFRQFDWKETGKHQKIGVIADELEQIDNHLVLEGTGGYTKDNLTEEEKLSPENMNVKCVDTFYLMGYYGKAIQELSEKIKLLEAEIQKP